MVALAPAPTPGLARIAANALLNTMLPLVVPVFLDSKTFPTAIALVRFATTALQQHTLSTSRAIIIQDVSASARINSLVPTAATALLNTSSPNAPLAASDSQTILCVNVNALRLLIALVMLLLSTVSLKLFKTVKSVPALAKTVGTPLLETQLLLLAATSARQILTSRKIVVSAMLDTIHTLIAT